MHDGMSYDTIQGHILELFKVGNPAIFKAISSAIYNGSWQLTTDSRAQYQNLIGPDFYICPSLCGT